MVTHARVGHGFYGVRHAAAYCTVSWCLSAIAEFRVICSNTSSLDYLRMKVDTTVIV